MSALLIDNVRIVNEGSAREGYIVVADGRFVEVGYGAVPQAIKEKCTEHRDGNGALLMPGLIDTHVHFREPGLTRKSTIATESAAAVAGGVTSFLEMPNTSPATVSIEALEAKKALAAATSMANYGFFIGATNSNLDEILAADFSGIPGIKLFMGSSTGNMLVDREETLRRLFREFRGVIAVHAEDEATIRANRDRLMREYGENAPVTLHSLLRSREACMRSSQLAVSLAREYDSRLHLLHISTAEELALLAPGDVASKRITAETCPHYLTFTAGENAATPDGYLRKCNPAVKGEADREALRRAVADDLIDVLATDHAPHLLEEKQGSLFKAASGMPGVKFMLPVLLSMYAPEIVAQKAAHNPATLYGIDHRGYLRPGYMADFVLVEPVEPYTIAQTDALSHLPAEAELPGCRWTPYAGVEVRHRVAATYVNGVQIYDGNKVIPAARNAKPLKFNN